jgi:hypothetical protein
MDTTYAAHPVARHGAPVRLTRRGRLVVFVGSLLLVLATVLGLGLSLDTSSASGDAGTPPATEVVTVGTGETLWDIASDLAADGAGEGDVRAVVQDLEELNGLDSAMLLAGQDLRVPVAD